MGVPKFFRWVAERCPTVITPFRDAPPPVDNLYLDMNGIIHNCTHPNDADATQRAPTEKEMVEAMFAYLEKLFHAIQPCKYFLLAVDGVAPRAKMNQQRQRRYRSGYDMMVSREEALARGEELPDEKDVFDSNCITPGTGFMVRVSEQFQYFVTMKIATDPLWQNCQVVYSGHDHPGEGEHKIVDFIRRRKMAPDYSPNETHCMYGLDADLIMLALATHEPHFLLLREVVTFGPGQQSRRQREQREEDEANGIIADKSYRKADEFVLFHVNLLRDYLDMDVRSRLGSRLPANYDFERVVDDFVFMCFFVGNDFLPSIPTLGINDGSMLKMLGLYCDLILVSGSHLTYKGEIEWRTTEIWLHALGGLEFETIKTREAQEQEYQRKRVQRDPTHEVASLATKNFESLTQYKERYYSEKLGFQSGWDPNSPRMAELAQHYLEGLMWVIGYYYQGPPSWKWYFPHHYAPMASDLVNLPAIASRVNFDVGKPFLPHQQLLAVLPPMSYRSIPRAYWPLLRSKSSPLAKYFPEHLQIDREGARAPWEGVVLIPFIEERVLLAAYESVQGKVTPEEQANNRLGPPKLFRFDANMAPYDLPNEHFGTSKGLTVRVEPFEFPPLTTFNPRLCKGVYIGDRQLEGYATLQSKRAYISILRETGVVTIFGMPTRKESLLLSLKDMYKYLSANEAAPLVGQEVLVGFPHYRRARIASISDKHMRLNAVFTQDGNFCGTETVELNRDESGNFSKEADTHRQYMREKLGINVEQIHLLVYVHLFAGMRVSRRGRIVRSFSKSETCYPVQLVAKLQDVSLIEDSRYTERDRMDGDTVIGTKVLFLGPEPKNKNSTSQVYGSVGMVSNAAAHGDDSFEVTVKVFRESMPIPPTLVSFAAPRNWMALHEVASELRVGSQALRMLTGSLRTTAQYGSREIGLGLLFMRNSLSRLGYAKIVARQQNAWTPYGEDVFARLAQGNAEPTGHHLESTKRDDFVGRSGGRPLRQVTWFSREAVSLIGRYIAAFQPLVRRLECGVAPNSLEPPQFMTGPWQDKEVDEVLDEMEAFVEASGIRQVPLVPATDDALTREHLRDLEDVLDRHTPRPTSQLLLRPVVKRYLYFPLARSSGGHFTQPPVPVEQTFRLGARVVNCRAAGFVPFGAVGTVVRLLAAGQDAEVVFDEAFQGGTRFDGRLRTPRGALVKLSMLLVLSRPGDEEDGAAAETPGERTATAVLKALLLKAQHEPKAAAATAAIPTPAAAPIPRPRSALEEMAAFLPNATVRSSPASGVRTGALPSPGTVLAMSAGSAGGGVSCAWIADVVAKANHHAAAPTASNPATPGTSNAMAAAGSAEETGSASAPNKATPTAPRIAVPRSQQQQQQQGRVGDTSPPTVSGKPAPKANLAVPKQILSGDFVLRHGEEVPFFRRLLKKYLNDSINKVLAQETEQK